MLMKQGRVRVAMRLLSSSEATILSINDKICKVHSARGSTGRTILEELKAIHPAKGVFNQYAVLNKQERDFHPIVSDCIDAKSIQKAVLRTRAGAGPFGADTSFWKRICTSFPLVSNDLCASLALVAKKFHPICLSKWFKQPHGLQANYPGQKAGVRTIDVGEVPRRIISETIIAAIYDEIKEIAGTTQQCAGQEAGCEVGVFAMKAIF